MRIYGNGILKTRSADFRPSAVRHTGVEPAEDEVVVLHFVGSNGEALEMLLSLDEAHDVCNTVTEQAQKYVKDKRP